MLHPAAMRGKLLACLVGRLLSPSKGASPDREGDVVRACYGIHRYMNWGVPVRSSDMVSRFPSKAAGAPPRKLE